MLAFNPDKRCSAKQALQHPIFNSFRKPELEQPAPFEVSLYLDEPGMYNYETQKNHELSVNSINALIMGEIADIHSNL